jgi:hypothetical protein
MKRIEIAVDGTPLSEQPPVPEDNAAPQHAQEPNLVEHEAVPLEGAALAAAAAAGKWPGHAACCAPKLGTTFSHRHASGCRSCMHKAEVMTGCGALQAAAW